MTDASYTHEAAAIIKANLETRLKKGETIKEMHTDIETYLELERGIFRVDHPINAECRDIPVWDRAAWDILRDVNNTEAYSLDETGICSRFVTEAEGWLAWNTLDNKWYGWVGDHWSNDQADLLAMKFSGILKDQMYYERPINMYLTESREAGKPTLIINLKKEYTAAINAAARIHTREMIIKAARAELVQKFDTCKDIPFKNGLFNPETGWIRPHAPENYNTTVCPVNLNLDAKPFSLGEKFFRDISCNDPEWQAALFRVLGECLTYGNDNQVFIVFYGSGQNGKGTLIEWLCSALGGLIGNCDAKEISKNNPDHRQTTIFDTIGKCRILLFRETGGILYDDDLIKKITGDKSITLTRIMTGARDIEVCGTPILITNNLPSADKGGYSMVRRQIGFPFDYRVKDEERDSRLLEKLTTPEGNEWLICQVVKALIESRKAGAGSLKTTLPKRVTSFTEKMIAEADITLKFLEDCCIISADLHEVEARTDLYTAFCGYAYSDDGQNPTPHKYRISQKTFAERLAGHDLMPLEGRHMSRGRLCRNVYSHISLNELGLEYLERRERGGVLNLYVI